MAASLHGKQPAAKIWGPDDLAADAIHALSRAALSDPGKAVLVGPVFDTIKLMRGVLVEETLDRDRLAWPLAWACRPGLEPPTDPPPAEWFDGAAVVRQGAPPAAAKPIGWRSDGRSNS